MNSLSRWQQFYLDDAKLGSIPPHRAPNKPRKYSPRTTAKLSWIWGAAPAEIRSAWQAVGQR